MEITSPHELLANVLIMVYWKDDNPGIDSFSVDIIVVIVSGEDQHVTLYYFYIFVTCTVDYVLNILDFFI